MTLFESLIYHAGSIILIVAFCAWWSHIQHAMQESMEGLQSQTTFFMVHELLGCDMQHAPRKKKMWSGDVCGWHYHDNECSWVLKKGKLFRKGAKKRETFSAVVASDVGHFSYDLSEDNNEVCGVTIRLGFKQGERECFFATASCA